MLARIAVHLPLPLWLQEHAQLDLFNEAFEGEAVVVHPPLQSAFEVRADSEGNFNVNDIYRLLTPVAEQRVYPFVRMDGQLVRHADLLQIDVVRTIVSFTSRNGSGVHRC